MPNSLNYIGAGGASIEKPDDYYGRIDQLKKNNNKANDAQKQGGVQPSTKVTPSKNASKTNKTDFSKVLQKNISSKNKSVQKPAYKNIDAPNNQRGAAQTDSNKAKYELAKSKLNKIKDSKIARRMAKDLAKQDTKNASLKTKASHSTAPSKKGSSNGIDVGTNIALEKLAIEYEEQIYGIMWNMIFTSDEREYQGGLGEEIFYKELVAEMQKHTNTGQMGPIAKSIFNDMVRSKQKSSKN